MHHRFSRWLAAGALLLASVPAFAGQEVTLTDERGVRQGTASLPLFVSVTSGGGGSGSGNAATTSNATDAQATSATNQQNVVYNYLFNGTTWDRMRGTGGFLGVLLQAPLPAGTNVIGAVTQSGGPWTISGTVAATQSGTWTAAVTNAGTFAVQNTAAVVGGNATAVKVDGSATTQPASEANGANVAIGSTTDAPITGAASTTAATLQAEIKGLYNLFQAGSARTATAQWWTEASGQALAANANFTGTSRSSGSTSGSLAPFGYFQATAYSSVSASLVVFGSGGTTTTVAIAAGTTVVVKVPAFGVSFQCQIGGNTAAATISLLDGYTVN